MIYRILSPEKTSVILQYCEDHNIDYDIWNAEDVFLEDADMELGTDWDKVPDELYLEAV